jgi:hypothetical protein
MNNRAFCCTIAHGVWRLSFVSLVSKTVPPELRGTGKRLLSL